MGYGLSLRWDVENMESSAARLLMMDLRGMNVLSSS